MNDYPKLHVGTMNDGLFIIDQPPRPAPKDHDTGTLHRVNVIATITNNDLDASALADLFAASPDLFLTLSDVRDYLSALGARLATLDLDNSETYGCLKTATLMAQHCDAAIAKAVGVGSKQSTGD